MAKEYVHKHITIRKDQEEFIQKHSLKLSHFVQKELDNLKKKLEKG